MAINVYLNDRDEVLNVHLNESGAKGEKGDPIKIVETTVDNQGNTVIKFNDGSTTTIKKGERGEKGEKGDGITVLGTEKNTNGDLVVKFSDGSKVTVPKGDKGEQGEVGKAGATGESAKITSQRKLVSGDTELSFNDGTKVVIPKGEKGDKGLKGDTGAKGEQGSTGEASKILSTEYDSEGNTVIKFNDGSSVTVKKGAKGDKGATGEQGKQGEKGDTGEPLKVLSTSTDNSGNTVIKFSDNSTVTVKKGDKGAKGDTGAKGDIGESAKIVTEAKDENGNTLITFNDGKTVTIKKGDKGDVGAKGEQGTKGDTGVKGDKGDSITVESSSLDTNGNTIIKFSDGKSITVKKGDKGEQGKQGEKGEPFKYEDFTKEQIDSLKASFNVREVTSLTGTGDVTTLYVYEGGLYFWNGTEYKKAVDLSKKVDTSSITSDENASGADKVFSVDFIKAKLKEMGMNIDKKVSEEQGKGLSTNDYTDAAKAKVDAIPANPKYTDTTYDLTPYAKTTDLPKNLSELADDETHRTVTDTEKTSWDSKAEKTDIPTKLSELTNDENFKTETEIKALIKTEAPKQDLSGYAKTTDLPTKVSDLTNDSGFKTETEIKNLITENAPKQDLTPYAKKTELPKNLSELTNDKGYKTEAEIKALIESSNKLKKSVVDKLPTTGKADVIYLVKDTKGKTGNVYLEYLWINNAFELIGSTSVDLSGYAKKTEIKTKLSDLTADSTHRLVTDTEKELWNSKVGKGDDISDNIVVYNECTDDVCNANTKKTVSEALNYINQSWQDSTGQLLNLYADLQSDVAGLKTSKASTTDIKTKLSEMTSDATHRTVTDTEKTTWNNKVDKVSGKGLSTNDFTTAYKNKLNNLSSTASGNEATTSNRGYMSAADKKKLDGIDLSKYAETESLSALGQEIRAIGEITTQKADKTDIKTKLSELTDDSTHRTVTDSEKSTWNSKLSSVTGQDVSRAKTKGYSSASSWTSVGSSRDVEDWIGDFDKRTRENKTAISGKVNQSDIVDMKKCKILTQSEYDALSSTEKNRADTFYFIKE